MICSNSLRRWLPFSRVEFYLFEPLPKRELEDFWNLICFQNGKVVSRSKGKEILYFPIGEREREDGSYGRGGGNLSARGAGVYIKKRGFDGWGYLFSCLCSLRRPESICMREVKMLRELEECGFSIMPPLAVGQLLLGGVIPLAGVGVFGYVEGEDLEVLFRKGSLALRRKIMRHWGSLLGLLHRRGFYQTVVLKDLICIRDGTRLHFTIIDREVHTPWSVPFSLSRARRALVKTLFRLEKDGLDCRAKELAVFWDAYWPCVEVLQSRQQRRKFLAQLRREYSWYLWRRGWKKRLRTLRLWCFGRS
ncbi:MAG: hypothetical protein D6805_00155 [Planctomycetota bacterium]|nr:MAG: hypothetical protein D6805_00155 [Planctomycetota bacterium]